MHNIVCILNNEFKINSNEIVSLKLEQDNNNILKASIIIPKSIYNKLLINSKDNLKCKILINNTQYFTGNIASVRIDNNLCHINFINKDFILDNNTVYKDKIPKYNNVSRNNNIETDILEMFKINNPSLFQRRNIIQNNIEMSNIENNIIKDSLKISIDKLLSISELDLLVSASWNKKCNGYCDLTNRIHNKLHNGLISTLTPNKLINSWPKLFDRLITNNKEVLKTKYFVTHSKLEEYSSNTINICNNKEIKLNETYFKCKLSIGWEYSQFITENLHCKIINNKVTNNNKQVLNINLHNVQEYIEDIYCNSFFKSKTGNNIFNIVLAEVKQFIINSMQNITIQFQIPLSNFLGKLQINKFIKINNYVIMINKIEISFIRNNEIVTITGIGSEYDKAFDNVVPSNILLNNIKANNDNTIDVLENIEILNTSNEQIEKINNIKYRDNNYKLLINDALNKNPTKLLITLKPIKTEHNKIEHLYIDNINL